jgi:DhnA family fructose-bisphosphate aldolase class Ia
MSWGRNNRLSRIFDPASGRTNMLAVDHGYFLGPVTGMEAPRTAIAPLLPYADALMATRGLLRSSVDPARPRSIVLRVSGGTSIVGPSLSDETIITTVEDALRLNGAAVTAGAAGIDFGRNAWQSAHPVATIQALRAVVHDGQGVDDALGLYERLAGQPVPAGR